MNNRHIIQRTWQVPPDVLLFQILAACGMLLQKAVPCAGCWQAAWVRRGEGGMPTQGTHLSNSPYISAGRYSLDSQSHRQAKQEVPSASQREIPWGTVWREPKATSADRRTPTCVSACQSCASCGRSPWSSFLGSSSGMMRSRTHTGRNTRSPTT